MSFILYFQWRGLLGVNGIVPEEAKSYSFGRIQSIWAESRIVLFWREAILSHWAGSVKSVEK